MFEMNERLYRRNKRRGKAVSEAEASKYVNKPNPLRKYFNDDGLFGMIQYLIKHFEEVVAAPARAAEAAQTAETAKRRAKLVEADNRRAVNAALKYRKFARLECAKTVDRLRETLTLEN